MTTYAKDLLPDTDWAMYPRRIATAATFLPGRWACIDARGEFVVGANCWLALDPAGHPYPIGREVFAQTFRAHAPLRMPGPPGENIEIRHHDPLTNTIEFPSGVVQPGDDKAYPPPPAFKEPPPLTEAAIAHADRKRYANDPPSAFDRARQQEFAVGGEPGKRRAIPHASEREQAIATRDLPGAIRRPKTEVAPKRRTPDQVEAYIDGMQAGFKRAQQWIQRSPQTVGGVDITEQAAQLIEILRATIQP